MARQANDGAPVQHSLHTSLFCFVFLVVFSVFSSSSLFSAIPSTARCQVKYWAAAMIDCCAAHVAWENPLLLLVAFAPLSVGLVCLGLYCCVVTYLHEFLVILCVDIEIKGGGGGHGC